MAHRTAPPAAEAGLAEPPPDIATMRETVNRLLDPDAVPEALPPAAEELDTLTLQLQGHLNVLMPEVEQAARQLSRQSIPRYCMLACLGEARGKLAEQPRGGPNGALVHARRLARVLNALADHYENLGSAHGCR
ncbi:hypothetical protein F7R91_05580 [Streptomyces luteolifulvus]|uniref:Uncharacterized protein n=1 Tax=Streptomyces luteolifulvus TaxID=2615112 RepID=A0A6H9V5T1_9ACTN|nr:DUF6415 family natural product biosynthesis protein [Streptomyces luteolifulvus]KAB1149229.1 hypothetical protein F7R91_05580 [Streptomyces luteolifulvus]